MPDWKEWLSKSKTKAQEKVSKLREKVRRKNPEENPEPEPPPEPPKLQGLEAKIGTKGTFYTLTLVLVLACILFVLFIASLIWEVIRP